MEYASEHGYIDRHGEREGSKQERDRSANLNRNIRAQVVLARGDVTHLFMEFDKNLHFVSRDHFYHFLVALGKAISCNNPSLM